MRVVVSRFDAVDPNTNPIDRPIAKTISKAGVIVPYIAVRDVCGPQFRN
jgi:hypothetical protein